MSQERFEEQRRRLPSSSFAKLFEGVWATASEDRLAAADDLTACITHDDPLSHQAGRDYICGVDLGVSNHPAACVIAHLERSDDGRAGNKVVVDRLAIWKPSKERKVRLGDIEEWIWRAHKTYRLKKVISDDWQAVPLAERLRARGLRVQLQHFSQSLNNRIALTLHGAIRDRSLSLLNDEGLVTEIASARLKEMAPHVYKLDADPGVEGHLDRTMALGLALLELIEKQPVDVGSVRFDILWQVSPNKPESAGTAWFPG